ncbi:hypothetical protein EMPS_05299 [Entomortierella parvispora]|uniref:Uncharacterized protein n=1 Tax=Entomortierella parvispora TaxID=205924 RepID=A0A9P3LW76_9FUNG|nr:hypothetical protein EMPS_05299 [Entomortierella parvispora]
MAADKPDHSHSNVTDPSTAAPQGAGAPAGGRSIFSVTMDPNALEQELDQAAQALHSSVNSLLNTMQASVFGGLETLSREVATFEKNSKSYLEENGGGHHMLHFPWSFRTDGPKKRYRITIEELPPLDEGSGSVFTTSRSGQDPSSVATTGNDEEFTITQGKAGTADEGKTVITTSVSPGLLDWLLFTTHEDSFFKRLGQKNRQPEYDVFGGTKITELKEGEGDSEPHAATHKRVVPALVEKVKQVGTNWEKDAKHWWQRKGEDRDPQRGEVSSEERQHHLFTGMSQSSEHDVEEERQAHHWPRGRSWGQSESFSQTTVTRPDGTVEHRTVNTVNGDTETVIKIQHPDGSVEETVTRDSNGSWGSRGRRGWGMSDETNDDHQRDIVAAVVHEAMTNEDKAAHGTDDQQKPSKRWPPKAWIRRNE